MMCPRRSAGVQTPSLFPGSGFHHLLMLHHLLHHHLHHVHASLHEILLLLWIPAHHAGARGARLAAHRSHHRAAHAAHHVHALLHALHMLLHQFLAFLRVCGRPQFVHLLLHLFHVLLHLRHLLVHVHVHAHRRLARDGLHFLRQ